VRLRREILGLQEKLGFSIIYVAHERDEAYNIMTGVVTMRDGRVGCREELDANGM